MPLEAPHHVLNGSRSYELLLHLGTENSVVPPKDNPTATKKTQWLYIPIPPSVNRAFCMLPRGSDDPESLLPMAVTLMLGPYFISLLLSLLLPNSLLLFSEMFSQKNYLYPVLVLSLLVKKKNTIIIEDFFDYKRAFLVTQLVKGSSATWET